MASKLNTIKAHLICFWLMRICVFNLGWHNIKPKVWKTHYKVFKTLLPECYGGYDYALDQMIDSLHAAGYGKENKCSEQS